MIKVFTVNKNNKIEMTKEELQKLLDEAYWDGYRANSGTWTYTTPNYTTTTPLNYDPLRWVTTVSSSGNTTNHTITCNDCTSSINSVAKDSN